ncbi:DUF1796 family putative cysteine peptidase [Paenibacillus chibensis]|uniref:DUF1796 family putative cysteine peptidase n=1 Tax=Paenibacillus chibensis TaxID=59846 RepID=A0ABU6PVF6_9BACL|nr:DUF1796 family putative cysteine peptidase [Paenibacillus chibensis]
MNRAFNTIFSLGHSCQVASQLRRNRLRKEAGPLDWFNFAQTSELCRVLRSRFQGFMELENLEVYGQSQNSHYIRDRITTCLSFHDFRNDPVKPPLHDYREFKERLTRRTQRLLSVLCSIEDTLLIRTIAAAREAWSVVDAVTETYPNPNVYFLFAIPGNGFPLRMLPSSQERVMIVELPAGSTWEGDHDAWRTLLQSIRLKDYDAKRH